MGIRHNTAYNLLGSLIPIAISFVTVPIYLRLIGQERYGILAIVWLLLGYFGLFDLGLGRATAQRIAALREGTPIERAKTFWTALILNMGFGIIGGLLIWPMASYFFGNVFKIEDALRPEVRTTVPWLVFAVPMAIISGVLTGALQGRERFFELNLISINGTIIFQILPLLVALFWCCDLAVIVPATLLARLITLLFLYASCWRHVFHNYSISFDRTQAGKLLNFGGWVTVTAFVSPMMTILDRFIIGTVSGAKAVSYYTVPFQLGQRSRIIPNALTSALYPSFAVADSGEKERLTHEALSVLIVIMTPLVAAGILFMNPFLSWWITPDFAQQSALVGQIIFMGFWINGFAIVPFAQLQAGGHPNLVAKCHLAELLPYFSILYFGLKAFGIAGAAAAFTSRVLVDFCLLSSLAGIFKRSIYMLMTPTFLLMLSFLIGTQNIMNRFGWFLLAITHFFITLTWAWRMMPIRLKDSILTRLKTMLYF
jgi:O-antigen/teichoic acid export membrane protein